MVGLQNGPDSEHVIERRVVRQPLVPIAIALILGTTADYHFKVSQFISLACLIPTLVMWVIFHYRGDRRIAHSFLWLAIVFAGCYWHHQSQLVSKNNIGAFCSSEPKLSRLRGQVRNVVLTSNSADQSSWSAQPSQSVRFELACSQLKTSHGWIACDGIISANVNGPSPVRHGDVIEIFGWLSHPNGAMNEGEFDFREYLKRKQILAIIRSENADALSILTKANGWSPQELCFRAYDFVGKSLAHYLEPRELHIAEAVLLGKKTAMSKDEIVPFLESGTLHLLVVSGMHLVLLFKIIWPFTAFSRLRLMSRGLLMLLLLIGYSLFTGGDPPVIRAAVVVTIFLVGSIRGHASSPINSLAAAAIFVLSVQPASLFQGGPQLSFVAVLAILLIGNPLTKHPFLMFASKLPTDENRGSILQNFLTWIRDAFVISIVAWLVAAPLVCCHFHLVSPASVILTPLLTPLITGIMALGPIVVLLHSVAGWAAAPFGCLMQGLLWSLREIVLFGEDSPGAYTYAPALANWWIIGFYVLLFAPWCFSVRVRIGRLYLAACLAWILLGLGITLHRPNVANPEFHQLAVGHGNCSVLRFPTGETIMYDCGSLFRQGIAERTIAPWLWSQNIRRLDAVIISHADTDHFSGLAGLAKRFPIGTVLITPQFARSKEPAVVAAYSQLIAHNANFRFAWKGDNIRCGDITLSVLAPDPMASYESDNSASMIIHCQCRDRSILLTGDLEGNGLYALLQTTPIHCDVLASPHHGGKSSNTPALAKWASPSVLVVSDNRRGGTKSIEWAFRSQGTKIVSTADHGCISITFPDGPMTLRTFLDGEQPAIHTPIASER